MDLFQINQNVLISLIANFFVLFEQFGFKKYVGRLKTSNVVLKSDLKGKRQFLKLIDFFIIDHD